MKRHKPPKNVSHAEVRYSDVFEGFHFKVYFNGEDYANFISVEYKTFEEAQDKLNLYLETGKFDWNSTR